MRSVKEEKRFSYVFKHRVNEANLEWGLIKYYQSITPETLREMLLEASTTFWIAHVTYQRTLELWEAYGQATDAIYKLLMQIEYLVTHFNLDPISERTTSLLLPEMAVEPTELVFRYQGKTGTRYGELIQFCQSNQTLFSNYRKVLYPSVAFWGAIAWQELGLLSSSQEKEMGSYCVYLLHQHIHFLENRFCFPLKGFFCDDPQKNQVKTFVSNQPKASPAHVTSEPELTMDNEQPCNSQEEDDDWLNEEGPFDGFAQSLTQEFNDLN